MTVSDCLPVADGGRAPAASPSEVSEAFRSLGPDAILDAVESVGFRCDGRLLALNSYENRVYQVGMDDGAPLIVKFYRPDRWSNEAILEEHQFCQELARFELDVVAPIADSDGATLFTTGNYRLALYPRRGGHAPETDNPDHLEQLGRLIARLHSVGEVVPFRHRTRLGVEERGRDNLRYLIGEGIVPDYLRNAYSTLVGDLLDTIGERFAAVEEVGWIRLHGDCHPGNILWLDGQPALVDFDDSCMGPAIQDLWMLLSGERNYRTARLADLLLGYTTFRDFNPAELSLIEPLRTLRMIGHSAWIARRWSDPAFPRAFPWYETPRYWEEQILALREQVVALEEPPLVWD